MSTDVSLPFCSDWDRVMETLRAGAASLDDVRAWPTASFEVLRETGVLRWTVPEAFGGVTASPIELAAGYMRLAEACLGTTFIFTQRNAATSRIVSGSNDGAKAELLPSLASGDRFATVGISHLTTSRQHLDRPAVAVRETDAGYVLDGVVPWSTGAAQADLLLTGGTLPNGEQVLIAVETALPGVRVDSAADMLALSASRTAAVHLKEVEVSRSRLIDGPAEKVMSKPGGGGAGSVTTSALAIGIAGEAIAGLHAEGKRRPELIAIADSLQTEWSRSRDDILHATDPDNTSGPDAATIRQRVNSLTLRATQAYLTASKGAGFIKGHPAERLVRQAMFFLVWSCPQPVAEANLREFACLGTGIDGE